MYELADLHEQSKEMDMFTTGKGAVREERIKMCCFSYLGNEKCLKKVVSYNKEYQRYQIGQTQHFNL